MEVRRVFGAALLLAALALLAGQDARRAQAGDPALGVGPAPRLPPPERRLIPTVEIAPARGWPAGMTPKPAPGLRVQAFATGLAHPRWLHVLPNGDVLVAETGAPPRPAADRGLRGWFMKRILRRAGAAAPSANRITLLRDADGDGIAELRSVLIAGLNSPFGMALLGSDLFVANTDAVLRFPYQMGATQITAPPEKLLDLPAGPRNVHWARSLLASRDGTRLYIGVGANSNVAEHGMAEEVGRAAIWELDLVSGRHRVLAAGLRNPAGMDWEPTTGELWAVVNERNELGNDLVPDFLTRIVDGGYYGWPYSYFGSNVDARVKPQRPELVAFAIPPDYALGAHVGALGLAFSSGNWLSPELQHGAFIGQHGSWNRKPRSGYNVVFVPFRDGRPAGLPVEVLGGFVSGEGEAYGRPAGVALDLQGALLVADDVGNAVWRVEGKNAPARLAPPVQATPGRALPPPFLRAPTSRAAAPGNVAGKKSKAARPALARDPDSPRRRPEPPDNKEQADADGAAIRTAAAEPAPDKAAAKPAPRKKLAAAAKAKRHSKTKSKPKTRNKTKAKSETVAAQAPPEAAAPEDAVAARPAAPKAPAIPARRTGNDDAGED
jgi:glucose/arabinose dehydrogenase